MALLYLQRRVHASDLGLGVIDGLLGVLFLVAFLRISDFSQLLPHNERGWASRPIL
jgi:hypothetical protein